MPRHPSTTDTSGATLSAHLIRLLLQSPGQLTNALLMEATGEMSGRIGRTLEAIQRAGWQISRPTPRGPITLTPAPGESDDREWQRRHAGPDLLAGPYAKMHR